MSRTAPEGTVTLLFTDIEASARLWEEAPADTADAVRAHDTIVRGAIERHGGYLLATGDDGLRAAFSTAADAAAAAIDSQRQLTEDARITFGVRMGLHTGEVVRRGSVMAPSRRLGHVTRSHLGPTRRRSPPAAGFAVIAGTIR
jgi:class 3 adenylate cyclase